MITETIMLQLSLDLYDKLKSLATEGRKEPKEVIEQLITTAYEQRFQATTPAFQSILDNAADLGVIDLAEHHDHYLYGTDKQ
jgi:hypothetical protein